MSMVTKIEKSGLTAIVQSIITEQPKISDQKVANILMRDYGDRLDNGKITWFAVRNLRMKLDKNKIMDLVDEGKSLDNVVIEEFNKIMIDGAEKAEEIYNLAKENRDYNIALKGLEQQRKNWATMVNYYKAHIIAPIQSITINEDKRVIYTLQKYQTILCASCRERINRELLTGDIIDEGKGN